MSKQRAVTVTFPAPLPAEIPCPICDGNKCRVCDKKGKIKVKVDAKVPIQRAHIVKYVVDNQHSIAQEITRMFGLTPQISTKEVLDLFGGTYEIVQISSIGGAAWVVNRMDELEPPRYYTDYQQLLKFKGGLEA